MNLPPAGTPMRASLALAVERCFGLGAEDAAGVLEALHPCVCRGGDWLFHEGDAGDCLYLLARGRLQVWIDAVDPASRPVAEVAPGETVGEISLLTGGPRSAGIRAVRDSLLLRMDAATLDRLGRERPALIRQLAGGIATRLRERTAGHAGDRRGPRTIALLPLDAVAAVEPVVQRLAEALAGREPAIAVSGSRLRDLGAPPLPVAAADAPSPAMTEWMASLEDSHRFVLLLADAADTAWTRLALRHADLVLLVAGAAGDPRRRPWEASLLGRPDWPVSARALLLLHEGRPAALGGTANWLAGRELDWHLHLRFGSPEDHARVARVLSGEAVGLVLGGGAARGFAHLGVHRALHEAGVPVDWVGGASIGAVFGVPIAQGRDPAEAIDIARRAFVDGKPFGDYTLPVVSLLRGRRMERLIEAHIDGAIEDLPIPFFCLSSNLGRGTVNVHARGPIAKALRAGVAIPGVFPPSVVQGQLAIDGGILDNLPVEPMRRQPVGRVIAVDVTSRQTYEVGYPEVPSPWAVLAGRMLPFARRYRVPSFLSLMLKAAEVGTMAAVRASGERADLLLRPPVGQFGFTDTRAFDRIVEAGYQHARDALATWAHDA